MNIAGGSASLAESNKSPKQCASISTRREETKDLFKMSHHIKLRFNTEIITE